MFWVERRRLGRSRRAHSDRVRRIGVLMTLTKDNVEGQERLRSLVQGLETLGWTHGRNVHIDARWPGDDLDRLRAEVADFVALKPDVIVAGGSRTLLALQQQIRTNSDRVRCGRGNHRARPCR